MQQAEALQMRFGAISKYEQPLSYIQTLELM